MDNQIQRKHYNNLIDSIVITVLMVVVLVFLLVPIILAWTGHVPENTDPQALTIVLSVLFGSMFIILLFWVIRFCYGFYIIYDDKIYYRNLYSKKVIMFSDIKNIVIKEESAFVLGTYKTDVLTISDDKTAIKIYINKNNKEKLLKFVDTLNGYNEA